MYWIKAIVPVILIAAIATLSFEIIMNVSWVMFFPYSIFALFLSGLPFLLIHVVSNIGFSLLLPFARKVVYVKGKFNEMDVCRSIIDKFDSGSEHRRLLPREKPTEQ